MNLKKAITKLEELANSNNHNLEIYAQAHALLEGFFIENKNSEGTMRDAYSNEKITSVRTYFQIICGIGEDGFTKEQAKSNLQDSIYKLDMIVGDDTFSLDPPSAKIARMQD